MINNERITTDTLKEYLIKQFPDKPVTFQKPYLEDMTAILDEYGYIYFEQLNELLGKTDIARKNINIRFKSGTGISEIARAVALVRPDFKERNTGFSQWFSEDLGFTIEDASRFLSEES